jgi:glycosyltransferase involved in cell wall biosynthesis
VFIRDKQKAISGTNFYYMGNSKGRIVYIGPMSFPDGGAGARRILGNALSLIEGGYEVIVGSGQMPKSETNQPEIFHGISVHSIGERTAEDKPVLIKHLIYTGMGKKTVSWLRSLNPRPVAVILFGGDIPYLLNVMPWCRENNTPLIFEACEWYDPRNMPGGRFSPYRINFEITMRYFVPRIKNVIAISSYLENHYKTLGCETVRIPPTIDTFRFRNDKKSAPGELLTIAYTGTPGKKDLFDNYLEALLRIDSMGEKFCFNVAGLSDAEILSYPSMRKRSITILPPVINNYGKVSHSKAISIVADSDFSILLRYPKRYAQAGFPTKVVESMVVGTPVICNLTSDLNDFIKDGISGIVCNTHTVESLIDALHKIQNISSEDILALSRNARRVAENAFDYRSYINSFDGFLKRVKLL